MSTLYRKYRPQKFSDLVEQKHLVKTLQNEISGDKIAHAYLFSGPRGVGKTTLARLFAKAVNCQNRKHGEYEPCDECSSCLEISASRNIDVIEIDAASHTGVDNVRENIIENAQFKPTKSKYKVFIIDEVHMLSTSAFNALLKTLEEPPSHAVFILATTEPQKIPATIISRCQRFNFKKINFDSLIKRLEDIAEQEKIKVDESVLRKVAAKSDGCMRDAESLLGQIFSSGKNKISKEEADSVLPTSQMESVADFAEAVIDKNLVAALQIIDDLAQNGISLTQFHEDLLSFWRLLLMIKNKIKTSTIYEFSDETIKNMETMAQKLTEKEIMSFADSTLKRLIFAKNCPLAQLPLELLAVELIEDESENETTKEPQKPKKNIVEIKKEEETKKPEVKKTSEETPIVPPKKTSAKIVSFEEINEKWPEVMSKINEKSPSLLFVVKMADLIEASDNILTLSLPYDFHQKKLKDSKNNEILQTIFKEIFGETLQLNCSVAEKPLNTEINDLAADFGGQVI
ncbi:MAG TPA: DNA polymerase III subunit gamma/tau [Candidatus Magasanikbacteria bacterium]|nr:DNA polymerase III subunit gamma/tau [Candidatus Magasanikbacteria bacterium]